MADKPSTDVSPLEYRTGLALVRYLDDPNTFKLAEDGKLDQILDTQLIPDSFFSAYGWLIGRY